MKVRRRRMNVEGVTHLVKYPRYEAEKHFMTPCYKHTCNEAKLKPPKH